MKIPMSAKQENSFIIIADYKEVMKQIEKLLPQIFNSLPEPLLSAPVIASEKSLQSELTDLEPLAKIDEIIPDSPACIAGLLDGDMLISFGEVNSLTPNPLSAIPSVVREYCNRPLPIVVKRQGSMVTITLTPRVWGGRGLLGCHLSPVTASAGTKGR